MTSTSDSHPKTSLPSTSAFTLLPATLADAESLERCRDAAFATSYLYTQMYPKEKAERVAPEERAAFRAAHFRKTMAKPGSLLFKIVAKEQPEVVVGFAAWVRPGWGGGGEGVSGPGGPGGSFGRVEDGKEEEQEEEEEEEGSDLDLIDQEVRREFSERKEEQRKRIWGEDVNYWYLAGMGVLPEYQRRGLASALLQEGIVRAGADGLPLYLESSPEGAKLYPKHGFEKVGEHGFFGGEHVMQCYIRPAKGGGRNDLEAQG